MKLHDEPHADAVARHVAPWMRDRQDWKDLALLALDHAGVSVHEQQQVWDIVGDEPEEV